MADRHRRPAPGRAEQDGRRGGCEVVAPWQARRTARPTTYDGGSVSSRRTATAARWHSCHTSSVSSVTEAWASSIRPDHGDAGGPACATWAAWASWPAPAIVTNEVCRQACAATTAGSSSQRGTRPPSTSRLLPSTTRAEQHQAGPRGHVAAGPGVGAERAGHDQDGRRERTPAGVRRASYLDRHGRHDDTRLGCDDGVHGAVPRRRPGVAGGAAGDAALLRRDRRGVRVRDRDGAGRRRDGVRPAPRPVRGLAGPTRRRARAAACSSSTTTAARSSGCGSLPRSAARAWPRALLAHLEELIRAAGRQRALLDTNSTLAPAVGLYESRGYRRVPDYNGNADADVWFAKDLG